MLELWQLFVSFTRASVFGFGGGPSMITLIQKEVVDLRGWLTRHEYLDAYAFGNALPSPIATKLAGYVGYHVAGWPGAAVALVGTSIPTLVLLLVAAGFYARNKDGRLTASFVRGVRPVVVALLLFVTWDFAPSAFGALHGRLGNLFLWSLAAVSFVLLTRFRVHPVLLILMGGCAGVAWQLLA